MCGACGPEEQLWASVLLEKARQCHLPCPQVLLDCSASVSVFNLKVISVFPDKQQRSSRKSFCIFVLDFYFFLRSENEATLIECSTGSSALELTDFKDSSGHLGRNFLTPRNSASRGIGKQICRFTN